MGWVLSLQKIYGTCSDLHPFILGIISHEINLIHVLSTNLELPMVMISSRLRNDLSFSLEGIRWKVTLHRVQNALPHSYRR